MRITYRASGRQTWSQIQFALDLTVILTYSILYTVLQGRGASYMCMQLVLYSVLYSVVY